MSRQHSPQTTASMKLWTFLTTDIRELNLKRAEEVTKAGADTAKAVLDLAKTAKEQGSKVELQVLQDYVGQFSSLLDVLNSPLTQLVKDTIPFAPLAVGILKRSRSQSRDQMTVVFGAISTVCLVSHVIFRSLLLP